MTKWISIEDKTPKPCKDILYTDGKKIYKGWLETYNFGEELGFYNVEGSGINETHFPEDITHWMYLPKPPKDKNGMD
jgi:hypothetical protein